MNFYRKASDIEAIENILNNNGVVKNFHNLHSKIYLFDDKKCIITSANLTIGGLRNNYEYGLYIDDKLLLKRIKSDFEEINSNSLTGVVTHEEISTAKNILALAPRERPLKFPKITLRTNQDVSDIYTGGVETITPNLDGWKLDVFKCLLEIESNVFSLKEVNKFEKRLWQLHPENKHIQAKIRQQLQVLRDIGLLEFIGRGVYRKLWE
jgi:phosphatidylserine/phosphatidylglycerophosphate/cardiolipin synthase-like enzyme